MANICKTVTLHTSHRLHVNSIAGYWSTFRAVLHTAYREHRIMENPYGFLDRIDTIPTEKEHLSRQAPLSIPCSTCSATRTSLPRKSMPLWPTRASESLLVVSCFLLLETLVALCHYLLQEMSRLLLGNHKDKPTMSGNGSQFGEQETIPDQLDEEDRLDKIYTESNLRCQEEKEEFEKSRNEAIHDYVYSIMASLLDQDEVKLLWQEIKQWIGDPKYKPTDKRKWHWKKEDVSNYDARHLIWNIAVRMGWKKFNTIICADFTKDLFPDLCGEIEVGTLMRNLKAKAREGYIKIDMPDEHNPIKFHNCVTE